MPLLAIGSGAAAAALAALPLTIGFFKDELFFAAALTRGPEISALAVVGAAMTLAYVGRLWMGIFLGPPRAPARSIPPALVYPVVGLGLLTILGGIFVGPATHLAAAAGAISYGAPTPISPAYHLDARPENLLALATYALGALILLTRRYWRPVVVGASRWGQRLGPERAYWGGLSLLNRVSDSIHWIEVRDLRSRVATILVPGGILIVLGVLTTPSRGDFQVGAISWSNLPLMLVLGLMSAAAVATTVPRDHLVLTLILSTVGFSLAVVYAFFGAPDVALVAVLIEPLLALLFLGMLATLPRTLLKRAKEQPERSGRRSRDLALSILAGGIAFVVVWGVLSKPAALESAATMHMELAPAAHASDVVTAILADFRGLDTLGEITVVAITLLGLATLLSRGRLR
jgi:multicomponent Na+:H+ antiporter subunit A